MRRYISNTIVTGTDNLNSIHNGLHDRVNEATTMIGINARRRGRFSEFEGNKLGHATGGDSSEKREELPGSGQMQLLGGNELQENKIFTHSHSSSTPSRPGKRLLVRKCCWTCYDELCCCKSKTPFPLPLPQGPSSSCQRCCSF